MSVENESRRAARKALTEAHAQLADAFEATAGAICTGYVTVYELTTAEGRYCMWLTGNGGDPDETDDEGLDSWRMEGLLRKALRDLDSRNVIREDE